MKKTKVKVCCIQSIKEAKIAISLGASGIGLVSEMPSGPGVISAKSIIEISNYASGKADTFLLTSEQDSNSIIEQLKTYKTNTVQIVDRLINGSYADIKLALPNIKIVQVLHVNDDDSIDEAKAIENDVDAAKTKYGRTADRFHPWNTQ